MKSSLGIGCVILLLLALAGPSLSTQSQIENIEFRFSSGNSSTQTNISNHSGFVTSFNLPCSNQKIFDTDNTTVFFSARCNDEYVVFSQNRTSSNALLNISTWELEDTVRLSNGTILVALSKSSALSTVRNPLASSPYDSKTFAIAYLQTIYKSIQIAINRGI